MQPVTATYPLVWLAGAANAYDVSNTPMSPNANQLYLIPFDMMRNATLVQIGVSLIRVGAAGAKFRLGIYNNNANNDNYPSSLLLDAGNLVVDNTVNAGAQFILKLNQALQADTRYWAALLSVDNTPSIGGLPASAEIHWGAAIITGNFLITPSCFYLSQAFGALPDPAPITKKPADLVAVTVLPGIFLGFSAVT